MSNSSGELADMKGEPSYLLVSSIKFTLLEKYIIKILEEKHACSDEEIADVLCLSSEEVEHIVEYIGTEGKCYVEGDSSRRTLRPHFTKMEYVIYGKDNGKYNKSGDPEYYEDSVLDEYDCREREITGNDIPGELRNKGARKVYIVGNEQNDAADDAHRSG